MATKCFSLVRGRALRVTKLDSCGVPIPGPKNKVVTKGVISVAFSAQNDEGTSISQTNANGDICIRDVPAPKFLNYSLEISLCGVDPDLVHLLTGEDTVGDSATTPNAVGFTKGSDVDLSAVAFSLELWSLVPGEDCAGSSRSYGYLLIPFIQGGSLGDFTWQNDAINFTVSGAITKDGNDWGVGPYNVVAATGGTPSPLLVALGPNKHLLVQATTIAPPTTGTCGAQAFGVPATTVVAGIPATTTPTNSYAPATLAGLTGVTASPTTAWTTGQYVLLQDGSLAHWTGTAWAAGAA